MGLADDDRARQDDKTRQSCIYRPHTHHVGPCLVAFTGPLSLAVASTMDWHILLFALYVTCLLIGLVLLLLVVRKHAASKRRTETNFPPTPTWRFRTQEALSLLTWVRGTCAMDNTHLTDRL
jgi:hypothetical protein